MKVDLKRALAEFVVIVTGVLVALAVDDWRSGRAQSATEQHLLAVLAEDLRLDSLSYASYVRLAELRIASSVKLLERLGEDAHLVDYFRSARAETFVATDRPVSTIPPGVDEEAEDLLRVTLGWGLNPSQTAMQELTSTGRLAIINPAELRTALVSYHQRVGEALDFTGRSAMTLDGLRTALRDQGIASLDPLFTENLLARVSDTERLRTELREVINVSEGEWQIVTGLEAARAKLAAHVAARRGEFR